jgi:hypothetical protein
VTGGWEDLTPDGPISDLDGDGIDDGCAYAADRLTFFASSIWLTADSVSAMLEYERVVRMVAGVPGPGEFGFSWAGDGGDGLALIPPGPMGPWPPFPPAPPAPPSPCEVANPDCITRYACCMERADKKFRSRIDFAEFVLWTCWLAVIGAGLNYAGCVATCAGSLACIVGCIGRGLTIPAAGLGWAECLRRHEQMVRDAEAQHRQDCADCMSQYENCLARQGVSN